MKCFRFRALRLTSIILYTSSRNQWVIQDPMINIKLIVSTESLLPRCLPNKTSPPLTSPLQRLYNFRSPTLKAISSGAPKSSVSPPSQQMYDGSELAKTGYKDESHLLVSSHYITNYLWMFMTGPTNSSLGRSFMTIPIPKIYAIGEGSTTPFLPPYSPSGAPLPIYGVYWRYNR